MLGRGWVLMGAVLWGTTGTAASFAPATASPVSIGAARIVIGGLLLLALAIPGGALTQLLARGRRTHWWLLLGSAGVAAYQVCFFSAVSSTGVAVGTVVALGSAPVLTGLLARALGQEKLSVWWAIATAAAVAGCVVLLSEGEAHGLNRMGVGLALLAGASYACYAVVASRFVRTGVPIRAVMGALFGGGGVLLTPLLLATSPGWLLEPRGMAVVAHLAVVTTVIGYLLYGKGLRTVPVAVASTLTLAEPAVAAILGVVVLSEQLTPMATTGLGIIGLALLVLVFDRRPREAPME